MRSSEQVAFEMYGNLGPHDRHLVDAWRQLGNDLCTSLINSGVLIRQGPRTHPATVAQPGEPEALTAWRRRRTPPGPDQKVRRAAEHEAAHAVVAEALGLRVVEISVTDDGSGACVFEHSSTTEAAAVRVAGSLWINEFATLDHPYGDGTGGCDDQRWLAGNVDDFGLREARATARRVLRERCGRVMEYAESIERDRRVLL